jgi:hypothetical protein
MSGNSILSKLLFALVFTSLAAFPIPHLFAEVYSEHDLISYNGRNLTQGVSKQKFLVNSAKPILIKTLLRLESTSKLSVIFLLNLFPTAPRTALSSTILLL